MSIKKKNKEDYQTVQFNEYVMKKAKNNRLAILRDPSPKKTQTDEVISY